MSERDFSMIPEWLWNRLVEDRIIKPRSVGWSRALWGLKIIAKQNEKKEYVIEFSNGSKVICSPNLDEFRCMPARSGNLEHFKTLVPVDACDHDWQDELRVAKQSPFVLPRLDEFWQKYKRCRNCFAELKENRL